MNFFKKNSTNNIANESKLTVEQLEERQMLSSVEIFAAGATGTERLRLRVDNQIVAAYTVGGDESARDFESFQYDTVADLDISQIKIEFANDLYDPDNDIDRNLFVDKIVLDGVTYETENQFTWASAFYTSDAGVTSGRFQTERLNVNGGFRYSTFGATEAPNEGTLVVFNAVGTTGEERVVLRIDGEAVEEFEVTQTGTEQLTYTSDQTLTASQISIEFINDLYDPEAGIDRNVSLFRVGLIDLSDNTFDLIDQESATTFSTGTWTAADGVVPGFGRGNTLHTNGYIQYDAPVDGPNLVDALEAFDQRLGGGVDPLYGQTFTDDQGRNYKLATGFRQTEVMVVRLATDGSDGKLDPTFGDDGIRFVTTGEDSQYLTDKRLIFDSEGNIGMVYNITDLIEIIPGRSAGNTFKYEFVGTTLVKLTSDGDLDSSFGGGDGLAFVPYTEGVSVLVRVPINTSDPFDIAFDNEDRFEINGSRVGSNFQALRNLPAYNLYEQATLRFNGTSFEEIG